MATTGHGHPSEISGAEALDIARAATPRRPELGVDGDPSGLKDGTRVTVTPDDTGRDPVAGVMVAACDQEVVVMRRDDQVGEVQVHFPRAGHDVAQAA